jgi:hypothetical protein
VKSAAIRSSISLRRVDAAQIVTMKSAPLRRLASRASSANA